MLKQWLRRRKLSRLSADPKTEGMMAAAEACCEAWKSHFETQEWRDEAADSKRAVSAIYSHGTRKNPRSPCFKKYTGPPKTLYGTRFNTGDYMVAAQWYELLTESGDGERREFIRGPRIVDVINSTEFTLGRLCDECDRRFSRAGG
jgi:hypothetical protein